MRTRKRGNNIGEYFGRIFHCAQMDYEMAFYDMALLCRSPSAVYKRTLIRRDIKGHWARDDPAMIVLMAYFTITACLAHWITFGSWDAYQFVRIIFGMFLIEFVALGSIAASLCKMFAENTLRTAAAPRFEVEWLYAFDVHCNAFVPFFMIVYVLQFMLLPILLVDLRIVTVFSNTLYAAACIAYWYSTWRGYNIIAELRSTDRFLLPIFGVVAAWLVLNILNINLSIVAISFYFT